MQKRRACAFVSSKGHVDASLLRARAEFYVRALLVINIINDANLKNSRALRKLSSECLTRARESLDPIYEKQYVCSLFLLLKTRVYVYIIIS